MSQLPVNRTPNNTIAEHVADHNEVHRLHNIFDGKTPFPDFTGSGSPEGVQTGTKGQWYQDTTNGALYCFDGTNGTNTGWAIFGNSSNPTFGISTNNGLNVNMLCDSNNGEANLSDTAAFNGSGNGIYWSTDGTDGQQSAHIDLGPSADFRWLFAADGSTSFPGPISAPNIPTFGSDSTGFVSASANASCPGDGTTTTKSVIKTGGLPSWLDAGGNITEQGLYQIGCYLDTTTPPTTPTTRTYVTGAANGAWQQLAPIAALGPETLLGDVVSLDVGDLPFGTSFGFTSQVDATLVCSMKPFVVRLLFPLGTP